MAPWKSPDHLCDNRRVNTATAADLASLGLFVRERFFDADLCNRLRQEADRVTQVPATITRPKTGDLIDRRVRSTQRAVVSQEIQQLLADRLTPLGEEVARHFDRPIDGLQAPQLLVYRPKDFFRPHQDNSYDPLAAEDMRRRRVAVVIFLNRQTRLPEPGSFSGGSLTFFMLSADADVDTARTAVAAEEGLLVAFPAELTHEVRPITAGLRYSVVLWFMGPALSAARAAGA